MHVGHFLPGFLYGIRHDSLQESIHCGRVVRHLWFQDIGGRAVVAHQLGLLDTQAHHILDELLVVGLVAIVATVGISLQHLLALGPVGGGSHGIGVV